MSVDWVVKVGGSLLDWPGLPGSLGLLLEEVAARGERAILIAGGGAAADAVRDFDLAHGLGEERAHRLALFALDLTARMLADLLPGATVIDRLDPVAGQRIGEGWPVVAPRRILDEDDALGRPGAPAHSWDVTSDSIAARLAQLAAADGLLLLKSAPLPAGADRREAARLGLVDPAFPEASRGLGRVEYRNLRDPEGASIVL